MDVGLGWVLGWGGGTPAFIYLVLPGEWKRKGTNKMWKSRWGGGGGGGGGVFFLWLAGRFEMLEAPELP